MRLPIALSVTSLWLAACGGDDGQTMPDAAEDIGFTTPTVTLKANREVSEDTWEEVGPADLSCLGTANADVASTVEVTINTTVKDFQSGNAVPGTMVSVFANQDYMNAFAGSPYTADQMAKVSVKIPAGTKRFGYRMTSDSSLPTFLLNQTLDSPSMTPQDVDEIQSVSKATAQTLSALIGVTRTPGRGIVAGALRDCLNREMSGYIATMSSQKGMPMPVPGSDAYYFSAEVGLPAHHNVQPYSSPDGLFMIIEIPTTTPMGYVQLWGFPTDADLALGKPGLKLIAELQVPVVADTVITGSYEPLRM